MWAIALSSCSHGRALPIAWNGPIVSVPTSTANRMPQIDPPAISPELNSVPAPSSDSSFTPLLRSTHQRTSPPAKIGAVVATGRYAPTANDSEWMPHSSSVTARNTPTSTRPHGRFWLRSPLMIVAISVACGAAIAADPIVNTRCRYSVVRPIDERRDDDADDQPDLLIERRGADDVAGLEILRGVAGVGRGDADHGADAERDRSVGVAGPAERDEQQAREDQRGDRHAGDRVRRRSDQPGDARRDDREEESEDDDQHGREHVALERHPRRDRQEQRRAPATRSAPRSSGSRARCAPDRLPPRGRRGPSSCPWPNARSSESCGPA